MKVVSGRDQPVLERAGDGERLEGRAGLVGEAGGAVLQVLGRWRSARSVGSTGGQFAIASTSRRARVHHDRRRPFGRVGGRRPPPAPPRCAPGSPRRSSAGCPRRRSAPLSVSRRIGSPSASVTTRRSPSVAVEDVVLARLEPGQALVVDPDRADHLRGELALRVDAAAVGELADPRQLQRCDPLGGRAGRPCGRGRRSRSPRSATLEQLARGRCRAAAPASSAVRSRVLDLVGRGEDRRRVLGDRELVCRCGRGSLPRSPGTITVAACWLSGLGGELAALRRPEARRRGRGRSRKQRRKPAKSRPIRRSISRIRRTASARRVRRRRPSAGAAGGDRRR